MITVTPLAPAELEFALTLTTAEGWGSTRADWQRLHRLGGALMARHDGEPAGVLTALRFPPRGVIGNVVVADGMRGHGIALALLEAALVRLADCESVRLYSTTATVGLYRRLGFVAEGVTVVYFGEPEPRPPGTAKEGGLAPAAEQWEGVLALDREQFDGDRVQLLKELAEAVPQAAWASLSPAGEVDGYILAKGEGFHYELGPWVVRTGCRGWRELLKAALGGLPEGARVDLLVPAANERVARFLGAQGFVADTSYIDMSYGAPWPPEENICARGGGDKG